HALVNLDPYLALVSIEMGLMPVFLHAVYCGDDFYAQVLLLTYKFRAVGNAGPLVTSTSAASSPPARKSSAAARTATAATGFLRTSLIDLQRSTFEIQSI